MTEEPIMELDELVIRIKKTVDAIQETLNVMHTKLAITDDEKTMALSWVINQLASKRACRYYEIKE